MKHEELENYINTYGKDLYSFCCYITHSHQEADDLYQDTFLKMYELGTKLIIRSNPKSFLMSVALNLYRNHKRKLSIRERIMGTSLLSEEMLENIPDLGGMVEDRLVNAEECQMVRRLVRGLPDKYRIPVLLYYMEELSLSQIAALLQMPENTVKTRIRRAKKILKEKLEEQD